MHVTRRSLLRGAGGLAALHLAGWPGRALAEGGGDAEPRLVLIQLRGGLDGLSAVPATGDPHFETARAGLAPGADAVPLPLDAPFGLHPALKNLHALYARGELLVVHAVATPYRERSHFDAQNLLESGGTRAFALRHGWLGRALDASRQPEGRALDASRRSGTQGVALGPALPLVLRGASAAGSWSPSSLPAPDAALLGGVEALYAERDPTLGAALAQARHTAEILGTRRTAGARRGPQSAGLPQLATAAAAFLRHADGPRVAVLEMDGWDTHNLQALAQGALQRNLRLLDQGVERLRSGLGPAWRTTVVVAHTEFGRTVAMNGSGGTDHGTAGAALVLGGAVAGGRVLCDWPGLRPADLHEGRDLRPTLDLRAVWKGVLHDHLQVAASALAREVFPDSAAVRPLQGLVRG